MKVAKRAKVHKKNKQVWLPNQEYLLLNSHYPSINLKAACNIMDCIYTNVELTTLAEKSDADIENSCTKAMYLVLICLSA